VVARKNIQTYKYGEKQQKAKEKTAIACYFMLISGLQDICEAMAAYGAMNMV